MGLYFQVQDALIRRALRWLVFRLDTTTPFVGFIKYRPGSHRHEFHPLQRSRAPQVHFTAIELDEISGFLKSQDALREKGRLNEREAQLFLKRRIYGTEYLKLEEEAIRLEQEEKEEKPK